MNRTPTSAQWQTMQPASDLAEILGHSVQGWYEGPGGSYWGQCQQCDLRIDIAPSGLFTTNLLSGPCGTQIEHQHTWEQSEDLTTATCTDCGLVLHQVR